MALVLVWRLEIGDLKGSGRCVRGLGGRGVSDCFKEYDAATW